MHGCGKSDNAIVPKKSANTGIDASVSAEWMEGRALAKGNSREQNRLRTQCREDLRNELARVRQVAAKDKEARFTALWHHVYNIDRLRECYYGLKRKSAKGVDGETWEHYGKNLEENLCDLSGRLKRGAYHAKPVKRVYIPKPDGRQRPIGVPRARIRSSAVRQPRWPRRSMSPIVSVVPTESGRGVASMMRWMHWLSESREER